MNNQLEKSRLGRSNLHVTRLGYGASGLRGAPNGPDIDEKQANFLLNSILDLGINFIDTSIDYGISESLIGKYISHRRSEFYLASKCACSVLPEAITEGRHVYTKANIIAGVEQSLMRMKTDYLDVIQFHGTDEIHNTRELLEKHDAVGTLQELQKQGKVRFLGASSKLPHIRDFIEWDVVDALQLPYSPLVPEHGSVINEAANARIGTIVRGGISQGEPTEYIERQTNKIAFDPWNKFVQANLDELRSQGESRTSFLLRLTLSNPNISTIIVGTKNINHLTENVKTALNGRLSSDVYEEANQRLKNLELNS